MPSDLLLASSQYEPRLMNNFWIIFDLLLNLLRATRRAANQSDGLLAIVALVPL